jgi:hypothetical protein
VSWADFTQDAPELAAFAAQRLHGRVGYLATVTAEGGPRVHPITPIVGAGQLFVFMNPESPKGHDLRRSGLFALHAGVEDTEGGRGEVLVRGTAQPIEDEALRAQAAEAAPYDPSARYVLFALSPLRVIATTYPEGKPVHQRWSAQ